MRKYIFIKYVRGNGGIEGTPEYFNQVARYVEIAESGVRKALSTNPVVGRKHILDQCTLVMFPSF